MLLGESRPWREASVALNETSAMQPRLLLWQSIIVGCLPAFSDASVNPIPKSWIPIVAMVAAFGVLFVLITPAPDELPSTGPHALNKTFVFLTTSFIVSPLQFRTGLQAQSELVLSTIHGTSVSLTCARLC